MRHWNNRTDDRQPPEAQDKPARISRQKKKRMTEEQEYLAIRDTYLAENPSCVKCGQTSTQVHHMVRGTAGKAVSRLNPNTFLEVCDKCHDKVERMKPEAQLKLKQRKVRETVIRLRGWGFNQ